MLFTLDTTTKTIQASLAGTVATNQLDIVATWADNTGTAFTEGSSDTATNNTSAVTVVAAPAAATRRVVKSITIENKDTANATVTLFFDNNGTARNIAVVTLSPKDTWTFDGTFNETGGMKTSSVATAGGSNTQVQYNNNGAFGGITNATSNGTTLTITSGRITTDLAPSTNDGATLGTTSLQFADLFLASGGVINFANGNYTLTHSTGLLTASGPFSVGTTNAITAGTIELGAATDTTLSRSAAGVLAVEGVVIPSISSTNTLTNKRVQPRTSTAASGDISPDLASANIYQRTALSANPTINAPTGTPVLGEVLVFLLKATSSARTPTWNATYKAMGSALPTSISTTKRSEVTCIYDGTDWLCVSAEEQ